MTSILQPLRLGARALAAFACACALGAASMSALADDAASLQAKHTELREQLQNNQFRQPIYIESAENGNNLRGDVYAVLRHPFNEFATAMKDPGDWCDILILPFNTKYCHAVQGNAGPTLLVRIGRKVDQPVEDAYRLDFAMQQVAAGKDFFETRLAARSGPVGTRDYNIVVSAVPIDGKTTFMHLAYSYGYGAAGRFAMGAYLSTAGANKVGFSTSQDSQGRAVLTGGMRGAIERNAMRYYLAIVAHMDSLSAPPAQRLDKRIQAWFDATERYPRQLHEMDRETYVAMKRNEAQRQQAMLQ
jgi:hypothetical protein